MGCQNITALIIYFNFKVIFINTFSHPLMIVVGFNWPVEHDHDGYYFEDCMILTEFKWHCYFDCKIDTRRYVSIIEHYLENYDYRIQ